MTGPQLKQKLFPESEAGKGNKWNLNSFAAFTGLSRQDMQSRFRSQKVNIDLLKQYAQWKGLNEGQFITYATGPLLKEYNNSDTNNVLHEQEATYKKEPKTDPQQNDIIRVMLGLIEVQREQNNAMLKLANAAEINAKTIAKMNGIV